MTCRTCKWLDVAPRKDGKIVPNKRDAYRCVAPIAPLPPMPASIQVNTGQWGALVWPPKNNYMSPDQGEGCPLHEDRK